ncbi:MULTISPECIES: glycerol-3-phosphate 1-O-acyltransferase PlsY [Agrobacterium tumefaciens complex]|jgi:glycerol-3-phosphate acyltransferase PlsY|uniref:Glycerol-3-phosphate acyltransferase n=1 Tax=Agrobacterium radiobacter TaxID=362 RepID=A0ABD5LK44_AGRRD|nr:MULTISPECIES: glycerol-3-phosphate 1-O-acyltransferase PlsY [Agrobacterium tumefaciens complex]MCP2134993.1 glycerol-3-phosphate acyltransferase PlsY [Rhizobium sp. SLBN-94]EPR20354.1 glycerol-3-phosphate acyltransferase [Agrobacterium radiobacter DSM 30147]MBB4280845.1 glycerol-3-phosphate acyltransferase PlsY [Agrobacterium radiobacter]MBB4317463.1 glycerol-3-phosphate acyltransferase PlsY [Agrobacterium radiobacter]MBB4322739.1 glycerol-3-phosphate acyltransferase PlsY [Agrobacterium rad
MSALTDWQTAPALLALSALIGYLFGSIPFGLLLTRMAGLGDVRKIGSGNIGATNVLRTGNKKLAAATLLLDALKGTAAVLVANALWGYEASLVAGFFAFLGHLFPVWLGFKGGKGVATYIGVLLGVAPLMMLAFALIWLATAFITRYSSLSALLAMLVIPVALWVLGPEKTALLVTLLSVISWWKHRENITRLLAGTESRIGQKG